MSVRIVGIGHEKTTYSLMGFWRTSVHCPLDIPKAYSYFLPALGNGPSESTCSESVLQGNATQKEPTILPPASPLIVNVMSKFTRFLFQRVLPTTPNNDPCQSFSLLRRPGNFCSGISPGDEGRSTVWKG